MFDIRWSTVVSVPELAQTNAVLQQMVQELLVMRELLMAELSGIHDALAALTAAQVAGSEAIAAQLTTIADEIAQLDAADVSQADLDAIAQQLRDAADMANAQAAQIRANSAQIAGMVPDEPAPEPPTP